MLLIQSGSTSQIAEDYAISFPEGLVGCPDWKRFVLLIDDNADMPVAVLRSLDDPQIELLITDPEMLDPQYKARLHQQHVEGALDHAVYCTLAITEDGRITANLLGPLVIDTETRIGRQVVLADSGYSTRHPIVQSLAA